MLDHKIINEIRRISQNIEIQLESFEFNFQETKEHRTKVENYTDQKIIEVRQQVKNLQETNDYSRISDIIDELTEIQSIIEKFQGLNRMAEIGEMGV